MVEEKKKRRDALRLPACLASFNEQYGDILKDFNHYESEGKGPGYIFCRASKYMGRFLDALQLIQEKLDAVNPPRVLTVIKVPKEAKDKIESTLLVKRKSGKPLDTLEEEAVNEMSAALKVKTVEDARGLFQRVFIEVNKLVAATT